MSAVLKKAVKLNHSLTGPVMGFSSPGNWFVAWQQQIIDWTEWQCRPIVPWKYTSMKWKYNSNHFPGELVQAADNLAPCVARPSAAIVLNTRDKWVLNCCMMTSSNGNIFPRYWPSVWGIRRSPGNCPHKGQWRGALMFSLICTWTNGLVNSRGVGDMRPHRAHYDVTLMCLFRGALQPHMSSRWWECKYISYLSLNSTWQVLINRFFSGGCSSWPPRWAQCLGPQPPWIGCSMCC